MGVPQKNLDTIAMFFKVSMRTLGNIQVACPYHNDNNPSASLNFEKQVFKCHSKSCGKGVGFKKLASDLFLVSTGVNISALPSSKEIIDVAKKSIASSEVIKSPKYIRPISTTKSVTLSQTAIKKKAIAEFKKRGFTTAVMNKYVDLKYINDTAGSRVVFTSPNAKMACGKLLSGEGPKYKNVEFSTPGVFKKSSLFPLKNFNHRDRIVWLVEGVFDAIALSECGVENVIALLTSKVTEENLFPLRNKTVFILLDSDYAGWNGTKELMIPLNSLNCNPIPVHSIGFADDPSDAYSKDKTVFKKWVAKVQNQFSLNDTGYVNSFVNGEEKPLQVVSTGIPMLNSYMGGGFKDGVHIIASEPGTGKTSYVCFFSTLHKHRGKRKLLCTYEIPKSQYWARNASVKSKFPWNKIELTPTILETKVKAWLKGIAKNLRIVTGWSVQKIRHVANDFDIIIVDYLQRMPSPIATGVDPSGRAALEFNIEMLANIARDQGKVVIVVSSLSRMGQLRGSGHIDFIVQSASMLRGVHDDDEDEMVKELLGDPSKRMVKTIQWSIEKNTRGYTGVLNIEADLGHVTFKGVQ